MTGRDGHVRVLPIHVANKIAAGEVVERPASVVKELVENSLDAGAASISVAIAQGGRKLVSVADDGCGMTRDDALLSLERQATSKILDVGDIERIDTLGFRGEAIPSIASVSRFTLTTRRRDSDEGTLVQVNAGELAEVRAAGCPPGTIVEVRDLFCNVPVRRKFLRSAATEESHIKNIFTVNALAHPEIAFTLTVDGRDVYNLPACETVEERITELFGGDMKNTWAFGDSMNDASVLKVCQYGVAMGNSPEELKEIADYVTDDVSADGVVTAMQYYKII
jgi:DNA mismatch repair protein MutL